MPDAHASGLIGRVRLIAAPALAFVVAVSGCFVFQNLNLSTVPRGPVTVETPVRVHMIDGSTVVFRKGARVTTDQVVGPGARFGLTLAESTMVDSVPLAQVLGMETYSNTVSVGKTVVVSTIATIVGTIAVAGIAVAIACASDPKCFGSCPTAYSDSAGTQVLEAEGFSYSIAPLFEMRDVDRLRATADSAGVVRLEVRNEAYETHYINQLELIDVRHARDEFVAPDGGGSPIAMRGLTAPRRMTDRSGRDVAPALAAHDGHLFATAPEKLHSATAEDHDDWIDLEMPAPDADSAVVYLRMRNSLLNTVLLYDMMLGDRGARAVDYMANDLQRIGPAVDLGRWYVGTMGMRVSVRDGNAWTQVNRISDTGPVAWKDIAVVVPVPHGSRTLGVRLAFVADNWRIDQVAVAKTWRRASARTVALSRVIDANEHADSAALVNMSAADTRYLETQAGQRFTAQFNAGRSSADSARTFFLGWQGYYIEWIRQGWITQAHDHDGFQPGPAAIGEALRRWRSEQDELERRFAATRVPVR